MQNTSLKTCNCPFCLKPIESTKNEYMMHLSSCHNSDFELLTQRLEKWCNLSINNNQQDVLLNEYHDFISYDRSFFPATWCDDIQEDNTAFYFIDKTKSEGKRVTAMTQNFEIKRLERIQNKELYLRFCEYQETNQGKDVSLFHGTRAKNINLICNQGFDRGHSKNGSYGFGIYLSSCLKYSLDYAEKSPSGQRCLLLCQAHLTKEAMMASNIHVIKDDFAVYPQYILYL